MSVAIITIRLVLVSAVNGWRSGRPRLTVGREGQSASPGAVSAYRAAALFVAMVKDLASRSLT
jgi:hypothetical protein